MSDNIINAKRITKNTVYMYIRTGFCIVVSLYTSRLVLQMLGVDDYGIYNIVGAVVTMFSILSNVLGCAIQRYITVSLGKGNIKQTNHVFLNSLIAVTFLSVVIFILLETIGLWFLYNKLQIPEPRFDAALIVYQLSIIQFLFSINLMPYNSALLASEKMSMFAMVGIIDVSLRLCFILIIYHISFDKLIMYAVIMLLSTILARIYNIYYCITKLDYCNLSSFKKAYDEKLIKEMVGFSWWSIIGGLTNVLTVQGINAIFNMLYGLVLNTAMGIASQVNNAIYQLVNGFQVAFNPQITKSYANSGLKNVLPLVYNSSKYSFYIMMLLSMPFFFNMEFILNLWLGQSPSFSAEFCKVILVCSLIDSLSGPLWQLIFANGKIRLYQILYFLAGLSYVFFVYIVLKIGVDPVIALCGNICMILLWLCIRLYVLNKLLAFPVKDYSKNVLLISIVLLLIVFCIYKGVYSLLNDWTISQMLISEILSCVAIWFWGVPRSDRNKIMNYIKSKYIN